MITLNYYYTILILGMWASLTVPAIFTILVFSVLITSSMTTADAAIFMQIEGITGDVTVKGFEGFIEVESFQFGVGRAISPPVGGERVASAPSVSEIAVTTSMSIASPAIFTEAVVGRSLSVVIDFTKPVPGGEPVVFVEYVLTDVLISGYSVSGSSGESALSESISLNFAKIEWSFTPIDSTGAPGTPIPAGYDLVAQKTV